MNRCEEVIAKKRNPFRSNDVLKHSETYMGIEFTEDLTHWKYIDRYRSNKTGKWVYVYANKKTHGKIQEQGADLNRLYNKRFGSEGLTKKQGIQFDQLWEGYQNLLDTNQIGINKYKIDNTKYELKRKTRKARNFINEVKNSLAVKAEVAAYKLTDKVLIGATKFIEGYLGYKLSGN